MEEFKIEWGNVYLQISFVKMLRKFQFQKMELKTQNFASFKINQSKRCIPIKLLVTTFDNSNRFWNCHFMHIK